MLKGGMEGLMKQAQEMQGKFQEMQDKIASMEVQGESGAGMVTVQMTGRYMLSAYTLMQRSCPKKKRYWKICWPPQ